MSLANRCDRCGELIPGAANFEKEDFDIAIMIKGELAATYEDLCPNCSKKFRTLLKNFEQVEPQTITTTPAQKEKQKTRAAEKPFLEQQKTVIDTPQGPVEYDGNIADLIEESSIPEQEDDDDDSVQEQPRELRNQVTKQYPVKIKHHKPQKTTALDAEW